MENKKLTVGQKIWIVPKSYNRTVNEPKEVTVSKIGNKYFELDGYSREKFNLSNLREENSGNYKSQCYYTLQEILDEREIAKLTFEAKHFFSKHNLGLSLSQLKEIVNIIKV